MDTDEAIRAINESFERLAVGARRTIRSAAAALATDLQPAAYPVFREVIKAGRVQASTIVGTLGMDKSAVSRHVKELREHGLIEAERDEHDARVVWISPTPRALEQVRVVLEEQQSTLRATLAGWSRDDVERFAVLLARFSQSAAQPSEPSASAPGPRNPSVPEEPVGA